uniref:Toll like receptor 2 n=1 Tax=Seriola lalandi dorsalis TaxID=1841481 RepID=A0A3B4YPT9_SERLL
TTRLRPFTALLFEHCAHPSVPLSLCKIRTGPFDIINESDLFSPSLTVSFGVCKPINISRNDLRSINSQLFTKLEDLKNIDMSGNVFHTIPETCKWLPNLRFLNLSSTHLTKVGSLHILDLSDNKLSVFNIKLPFLTELYISGNKIGSLPDSSLYLRLESISIQNNDLQKFSSNNLNDYKNLKRIRKKMFESHRALSFSLLCSGILVMFLLFLHLCHKYNVVWYIKMTLAYLKAERKPKLKTGELEYDGFVSYSEMDSGWVKAHLVPELEQCEPPFRLCLHKRDFVPGGWIIDNIMDAIEKMSEWCKYELDYTHFRLFDQNDDTVVLILLEPIDKNTIPEKFCKLRRVMNSRTYLEWPDDDNQIARFWQSLRTAIKIPLQMSIKVSKIWWTAGLNQHDFIKSLFS